VVIGSTIGLDNNQLVGTDEQCTADFQQQLDNPNIKAIWCVKGGYGTVRIIDSSILLISNNILNGL
jgi:muramoyltetrapeptide carboxypeptidase